MAITILISVYHRIIGDMVSVLASSVVDSGFEPGRIKQKTMQLVFVASLLRTQLEGGRRKTGWVGIGILCRCGATCIRVDCCSNVLALKCYVMSCQH